MSRNRKKQRGGGGGAVQVRRQHDNEGRGATSRPSAVAVTEYRQIELRKGPIPDAEELVRYADAHPAAPSIILGEFTTQGAHRRMIERRTTSLERRAMEAAIQSEQLGLACALLIALVGFGCGTYLVATDHEVAGTVIFGLDVGALVSTFILGRRFPPPEQKQSPG
jgi:hypothetical protein